MPQPLYDRSDVSSFRAQTVNAGAPSTDKKDAHSISHGSRRRLRSERSASGERISLSQRGAPSMNDVRMRIQLLTCSAELRAARKSFTQK
jgi:hypothetical protein